MKRRALLLSLLALAAASVSGCDKRKAEPPASPKDEIAFFPDNGSPTWKFRTIRWPDETNVWTEVFPVEPVHPPFDLIGTFVDSTIDWDFLIRMRIAGDGIQPIVELWTSSKKDPGMGQLFVDWTTGRTEIDVEIDPDPDSASGLKLDSWSWETKRGSSLGPGMCNADFGSSPAFASVSGKPVHPFALSHSSSNGVLKAFTWSDPVRVATHPVFRADGGARPENGNAASGATLEKELRSFPTPDAMLRNVPLGELVDLLGHVFRSERVCAGEPSRSAVEGGTEWFLPFFEGPSDGPDPERLVKCSGFGNLPERFVSDPRISTYVRDADALMFLEQIAAAANGSVSVVDGGVRIFVRADPATNALAASESHAVNAESATP